MYVDAPALDWITLTTFSGGDNAHYRNILQDASKADQTRELRIPRYLGIIADGVYLAMGEQNKKRHYMLQLRGAAAERYKGGVRGLSDSRCTRVDCQITIEIVDGWSARDFHDKIKRRAWPGTKRNHRRKVNLIENEGFDTVYIGSKSSEKRLCIYVKEGEDGKRYLRFEVRYKKDKADVTFGKMLQGEITPNDIVGYELSLLPKYNHHTWLKIAQVVEDYKEGVAVGRTVVDKSTTYLWFQKSVVPSLRRLINDHDYGPSVAVELESILRGWMLND